MALRVGEHLAASLTGLRYEPIERRVRAWASDRLLLDSTHALLVWEPGRIVPQYAVPVDDVRTHLTPDPGFSGRREGPGPVPAGPGGARWLTPETGFGMHTCPGAVLTLSTGGAEPLRGAGFRPEDPELAGHVVVDFTAPDRWAEEDEDVVGHPRDPFHRVDARRSSRHVVVRDGEQVLADSTRPMLVFETNLPVRHYLPRADVVADLHPSDTVTTCAYKGRASYLSSSTRRDVAWTYPAPLPDAAQLTGLVAFFGERVDIEVDGVPAERHPTPWS
ncbi:DUF427 domain-containing protein [Pseudonocardia sp.]|uniref:DUF427 domain-containing protein n=1 Tax=Pseudonocardia sp. TaxID=60912 RepID=UPI003D0E8258